MDASVLKARMNKSREKVFKVDERRTLVFKTPYQGELQRLRAQLARQLIDIDICRYAIEGWDGFIERDFDTTLTDNPCKFDQELFEMWLDQHQDVSGDFAEEIGLAMQAMTEEVDAGKKS